MSQWERIKCLDSSGKPYWHLKNLTTGTWFDVRILRAGQDSERQDATAPLAIEVA